MKKPYPKYKETKISWLPHIPEGWETAGLNLLFQENKEKNVGMVENTILSLSYGNIVVKSKEDNFGLLPDSFESYQIVKPGYIILRLTDLQNDKRSLRVGLARNHGIITSAYVGLVGKNAVATSYYYYLLHTLDKIKLFYSLGGGVRQSSSYDEIRKLTLPVPSLPEQKNISAYLDHKCTLIDTFIQKKTRLIELLKEQKQAIINKAVARGIDPNVKLKPSGIEWLGDIPEHWEVKKLKYVATVQSGIALNDTNKIKNSIEVPYLRVANVQDGFVDLDEIKTIKIPQEKLSRYLVEKGDLLMNEGGDFDKLGRGVVWEGEIVPCVHQNHVYVLKVKPYYNPYWLNLLTRTDYGKAYFISKSKQTTNLASISSSKLKEFPVIIPSVEEIESIKSFIDQESTLLSQTIQRIEKELSLAQEYKTTLIAEAVTGKIDVRDWQPKQMEEETEQTLNQISSNAHH